MEKYTISISNTWAIECLKNVDKQIKLDEVDFELPFGQSEFYDGKINWLLDILPLSRENIDVCRDIEAFNEKAYFTVMQLDEKWAKVDEFEGTFIDALEYIQKAFNG